MNLRYYLRGLGMGIFVTVLVLSNTSLGSAKTFSDEEIREKAKALGMTEKQTVLSDLGEDEKSGTTADEAEPATKSAEDSEAESVTDSASLSVSAPSPASQAAKPSGTWGAEEAGKPQGTPGAGEAAKSGGMPVAEDAGKQQEEKKEPPTGGMGLPAEDVREVTIEINSGESSYGVCRKLEEAGLISSASDYDTYLCSRGYDKKMRTGSHVIPMGADEETIAKILADRTQ